VRSRPAFWRAAQTGQSSGAGCDVTLGRRDVTASAETPQNLASRIARKSSKLPMLFNIKVAPQCFKSTDKQPMARGFEPEMP
jgi:hypothetical protein